jgi:hypothetical protein
MSINFSTTKLSLKDDTPYVFDSKDSLVKEVWEFDKINLISSDNIDIYDNVVSIHGTNITDIIL